MSKAMTLVLLLLLVESLSTTVLSEEVETIPTTYSPTHIHMTLPSTGRRMLGLASVLNRVGNKIIKHAKDVVGVAVVVAGEVIGNNNG